MRNNWARSKKGSTAVVKQPKTRATSHTIISVIHSSSVIHVAIRKPPPRKETQTAKISTADPEVDDDPADNKSVPKGTTTAHFHKFMNELLTIMDIDQTFKGNYIVMDNVSIHKSKPVIRKIESKGYMSCTFLLIRLN